MQTKANVTGMPPVTTLYIPRRVDAASVVCSAIIIDQNANSASGSLMGARRAK